MTEGWSLARLSYSWWTSLRPTRQIDYHLEEDCRVPRCGRFSGHRTAKACEDGVAQDGPRTEQRPHPFLCLLATSSCRRVLVGRPQRGKRTPIRRLGAETAASTSQQVSIPGKDEVFLPSKDRDHLNEKEETPSKVSTVPSPWRRARKSSWLSPRGGTPGTGSLLASPATPRDAHVDRNIAPGL